MDFESLSRLTIGQYLDTGSPVHRTDPRVKIVVLVALVSGVVLARSVLGLSWLIAMLCLLLIAAGIPLRFAMTGVLSMLPYLLLLAVIQMLAIPQYASTGRVLLHWGPVTVSSQGLGAGVLLILRFWAMALGLSLFSFSTTTTELLHGIEHLLRPFRRLGLPAHELALVMNVAIRFVPILGNETERLMKAQASRGADFAERSLNPLRRVRAMLPLLVPLFLMSLRRADQLVEAMEARCYLGGRSRTHLIHLHARVRDYVVLTLALLNIALAATYGRFGLGEALGGLFSP